MSVDILETLHICAAVFSCSLPAMAIMVSEPAHLRNKLVLCDNGLRAEHDIALAVMRDSEERIAVLTAANDHKRARVEELLTGFSIHQAQAMASLMKEGRATFASAAHGTAASKIDHHTVLQRNIELKRKQLNSVVFETHERRATLG